jgi:hypothetical protein
MMITPLSSIGQLLLSGINSLKPGSSNRTSTNSMSGDSSQVSPFAQLMSTLQQLQQSNPAQYKQITATLASNLQQAATTAQNSGEAGEANALNQLATSFNQASQSGQLPAFLQQGTQAGQMHHHHHGGAQGLGQDLNSISQTILSRLASSASGTSTGTNSATQ